MVEHYHHTLCEREDAQDYLKKRGLTDSQLVVDYRVGYADGSLLKLVPKDGELREQLLSLGVLTKQGRELLGGCIVVPIPDPLTGQWVSLYGRGMKTDRHCYLPGPFRGVVNYQAARSSSEIILTESILDALSFHQAGIKTAIPIYGTNGFTSDHLDLLKREAVSRVVLALDNDDPGRKATETIKEKISSAGISVSTGHLSPRGSRTPTSSFSRETATPATSSRRLITEASTERLLLPRATRCPTNRSSKRDSSSFEETVSPIEAESYPVPARPSASNGEGGNGEPIPCGHARSVLLP